MPAPQILADVRAELFAQEPGRDAFEGGAQDRQGDFGRVVDQQVDVVLGVKTKWALRL